MRRIFLLLLVALASLTLSTSPASARQATPAIDLATPPPAACTVPPRSADKIETLLADTGSASAVIAIDTPNPDAATPTPFNAPAGTVVTGSETADAIAEVVTQFYACRNAHDALRMFALMTDDFVVRTVAAGQIDPDAFVGEDAQTGGIVSPDEVSIDTNGIVEIEPGVYGVNVVGISGATGEGFTDYLVVVRVDDRFLIDDLLNLG